MNRHFTCQCGCDLFALWGHPSEGQAEFRCVNCEFVVVELSLPPEEPSPELPDMETCPMGSKEWRARYFPNASEAIH
jgi:hypothetical protein